MNKTTRNMHCVALILAVLSGSLFLIYSIISLYLDKNMINSIHAFLAGLIIFYGVYIVLKTKSSPSYMRRVSLLYFLCVFSFKIPFGLIILMIIMILLANKYRNLIKFHR